MALFAAPHPRDLTDELWDFIGPFLPELARRRDGRGRPWRENRAVLNGILPMRILAPMTLASIMAGMFGGELLDPIGVPGIWFPFGIGVSRTQYIYAIAVPLLAVLIVQTLPSARERR